MLCAMSTTKDNDDYRKQLEEGYKAYKKDLANSSYTSGNPEAKLEKIIAIQEKQLYWIRIIGIPFLLAAIGSFLALVIRVFN